MHVTHLEFAAALGRTSLLPLRLIILLGLLIPLAAAPPVLAVGDRGADGEFERRDSFHFTLYQDVDIDEEGGLYGARRFEQQILAELEKAFDNLDRLLGLRPEGKLVVYVWDPALFDREYAGLFRFPAAGFYGGAIHIRGGDRVTPRLVDVLHHELVHAAFDAEAPRLTLPAWLNEGVAEWFEARAAGKRSLSGPERAALIQLARQGALFSLADLSTPSLAGFAPNAAAVAYLQSYGFIDHLVQVHGEADLIRFWSTLIRTGNLERATRRAYRAELSELESGFLRDLREGR